MVVVVVFASGCASVSVREERWSSEKITKPAMVYVADFEAPEGSLRVDREGRDLAEFRAGLARAFSAELRDRISGTIAPARPWMPKQRVSKGSWVVEGRFLRVNQGSRLLRTLVGLGAGGTKFETRTVISEADTRGKLRPIGEIETTGGSNAEPGLLTAPTPVTGGVRAVLSATLTGLTPDQRRTARMITAAMAEKLESQGFKLTGQREKVKRPKPASGSTSVPPTASGN